MHNCTISRTLITLLVTVLSGCGGGGGGEGSDDLAAIVSVQVSPGFIDTGDRTTVAIQIDELNQDGAALKVRFPVGLKYVLGSSELSVDGDTFAIAPTTNVSDTSKSYLVYYLTRNLIPDGSAELRLKLIGISAVTANQVEVDADLNDPLVDDQDEFRISSPNFSALTSDGITVK